MWTVFEQIVILLLFVAIGFTLGKTKIIKAEHSKVLSTLLVYVFYTSSYINTNFNPCLDAKKSIFY